MLSEGTRQRMVDMRITRLVKDAASGAGSFATIDDPADVIKLAGVHAPLDVVEQFGVDKARDEALDTTTRMAIGAGFDALRDAGIPLVMSYKTTTLGTSCPTAGACPRRCGTTPASSSPRPSPVTTGSPRPWRAMPSTAAAASSLLAVEGLRARMPGTTRARAEVDP